MKNLCIGLSIVSLLFAALPWIRIQSRAALFVLLFNFFGTAWAHYVALVGAVAALLGLAFGSVLAFIVGLVACVLAASHVHAVTVPHDDALARGLGGDWRKRIGTEAERKMLQHRWSWRVPSAPAAEVTRDVAFATVSGAGRPSRSSPRTRLATWNCTRFMRLEAC
ncbi:hypothetical protein [Nannocystis pusilla]|uniref:hypothetical protein n=1 Tax=Nannocystis pusilla TaxID=889268 RepID=UPI003BF1F83F